MIIVGHAYDIDFKDDAHNRDGDKHSEIRLWCFDRHSNPFIGRVREFPNFCKVELPVVLDSVGRIMQWDEFLAEKVFKQMVRTLRNKDLGIPKTFNYVMQTRLYYYSNKMYPYMILTFDTKDDMQTASRVCKNLYTSSFGKIQLVFRELDVAPENKMFSLKDCGITGKFRCKGVEIKPDDAERISKVGPRKVPFREFEIEWRTFQKLPEEECNWISYPIVFSYDIEARSHRKRAFPQKKHHLDICFSIAATIQKYKHPETERKVCIIMGPTKKIEGSEVIYAKDEMDVLDKFFKLIEDTDPDVLIGYNIFGFDYEYLESRLSIMAEDFPNCGRLLDEGCKMESQSWQSSAYGHVNNKYLKMPGRISIDMLPYIKRDYKLSMYNLSSVGKYFLGDDKTDLKAYDMFCYHENIMNCMKRIKKKLRKEGVDVENEEDVDLLVRMIKDREINPKEKKQIIKDVENNTLVAEYNIQDTVLVMKLFEMMNVWINIIELSDIVRVTPIQFFTRGQQLRCIAQLYDFASHRNVVLTQREMEYLHAQGAWVGNPLVGFWKMVICLDFNSLYPSIMIAYNICFTTLLRTLRGVPDDMYNHFDIEQEEPKEVKPPKDDDFDYKEFASDAESEEEEEDEDEEFESMDGNGDEKGKILVPVKGKKKGKKKKKDDEKVIREYHFGFVKPEVKKGLLPEILEGLLSNRKIAKKEIKKLEKEIENLEKDTPQEERGDEFFKQLADKQLRILILDAKQKGLKISANSVRADTPIPCMINGKFCYRKIEELGREGSWIEIENGEMGVPIEGLLVWSDIGFTKVKYVYRHKMKTGEKLKRVSTEFSSVVVTEDHSLLDRFGNEVTTKQLKKGNRLKCRKVDNYYCRYRKQDDGIIRNFETIRLEKEEFVYDIETESHHFAAGVGDLIVHNSLYGFTGAQKRGKYSLVEATICVTSRGRDLINEASRFFEKYYGATTVYGDSVLGDEPLLLQDENGLVDIKTIETLSDEWFPYEGFKVGQSNRREKQQGRTNYKVWTADGWAEIKRVIRHKTKKKIYKVNTYSGCVEVTEDHSLMDSKRNKLKPEDCNEETELYHSFPKEFPEKVPMIKERGSEHPSEKFSGEFFQCTTCKKKMPGEFFYMNHKNGKLRGGCKLCQKKRQCEKKGIPFNGKLNRKIQFHHRGEYELTKEEAWVWGLFFADGSCGYYDCESGAKRSWAINKSDIKLLEEAESKLKVAEEGKIGFKILNTLESSHVYKLVPIGDVKYMVEKYRDLFYDKDKYKIVPKIILNATEKIRYAFLEGYYRGDGSKTGGYGLDIEKLYFCCKGKIGAQGLYYICRSLGIENLQINIQKDKENIYFIRNVTDVTHRKHKRIRKIDLSGEIDTETFVYDLETSKGNFAAGVGCLNILNTDSTMVHVPSLKDDPKRVWEVAKEMEREINGYPDEFDENGNLVKKGKPSIFPPPLYLEAEKMMRVLFMKKKHYLYMEYDKKGNIIMEKQTKKQKEMGIEPKEQLNSKGVLIARRDNCQWVRDIYEEIARERFAEKHAYEVFENIVKKIIEVIELKFDIGEQLSIVRGMGANYKSKSYFLCIFGELMKGLMKPIQPGERFPYVIVQDHKGRDKVGYKMRTIEMFMEQWESAGISYGEEVPKDYKVPPDLYPPEKIDSFYYIANVLMKPLDRLFNCAYKKELEDYEAVVYKPQRRRQLGKVSIVEPVKMFVQVLKDYRDQIEKEGLVSMIPLIEEMSHVFRNRHDDLVERKLELKSMIEIESDSEEEEI